AFDILSPPIFLYASAQRKHRDNGNVDVETSFEHRTVDENNAINGIYGDQSFV
ncbi:hypothetical protein EBI_26758, partial [Enterocytozoon bieneusi H348]